MKKLKLFFACLLMAVLSIGQVWADATFISANEAATSAKNGISLSVTSGSLASGDYYRIDKGATLTISSTSGNIESIVFTCTSSTYAKLASHSPEGTYSENNATVSWSGSASEVTFTAKTGSSNKNFRFSQVVITTAAGEDPTVSATPEAVTNVAAEGVTDQTINLTYENITDYETEVSVHPNADGTGTLSPAWLSASVSDADDYATVTYSVSANDGAARTAYIKVYTTDGDKEATTIIPVSQVKYSAPTGTFEPFSGDIEEGDYLIVADGAGMNTTVSSNRLQYTALTLTGENYVNPDESVIWHIAASATVGYWTIYSGAESKYAAATGSNNQAQMLESGTDNKSLWEITHSEADYTIKNKSNSRFLKKNGTYGFACYADGTVSLYKKVDGAVKPSAGLAFDAAQKLAKVDGTLTAPNLSTADGFDGTVTYASSDETVVKVNASTGAITEIVAAGKAVITAHSDATENFKEGSASYTIFVAEQAGTADDPLNEASAKALIDLGCTLTAHVNGVIATPSYYSTSQTYTVTLTNGFQFFKLKDLNNVLFTSDYLKAGDELTVVGPLGKYNDKYQLGDGCYIVNYVEYTEPLTPIANDKDHPYTVAQTLGFAAAPTTYDLTEAIYIAGVVYKVENFNLENGTLDIYVKDATEDNQFEFFKCKGIYGESLTAFTAEDDVRVGDEVIGYGVLKHFTSGTKDIWEFDNTKDGDYLVALNRPAVAVESVTLESTASVAIGGHVTLHAAVVPENASNKTINWSIESGNAYVTLADGVVTGVAEGTAVIRATSDADATKYAECTVTVAPLSPWATVYTSNITLSVEGGTSASVAKVKFDGEETEYAAIKAGVSATAGAVVVTVPAGATALHFHAYSWYNETVELKVSAPTGVTVTPSATISINQNSGISNNSPFTLEAGSTPQYDAYYAVSLSGNTEPIDLTISATSGKRFVLFGVNQVGGLVLESISVGGTASVLEYTDGQHFDPTGLSVTGHYSDASTAPITEDIVWAFDPDPLTEGTTSVSVTATAAGFTSDAFVVNGLTVGSAAPLSPWATTWTSNLDDIAGSKVKFYGEETEYAALKAGTGNVAGTATLNIPAQATELHLHAYGWNSEDVTLSITAPAGVTVTPASITLNRNSGFASNSPFTLAEGSTPQTDAYYALSLSGNTDAIELTISATAGKRFLLFGVNQVGGVLPELQSIAISGDVTKTSGYKVGDQIDPAGLTVMATSTLGGVPQTPEDVTAKVAWSHDPLTEGQTEVSLTATYEGKTDNIVITLTEAVASADPSIYVSPSLYVNFGSVDKDAALPADQTITVTLTNVAAGTATLAGDDVFSIDKTALAEGENVITISVASTATAGEFSATITLTDNASAAPQKVVNLSFTVNEPVTPEDPEVRKTWDLSIASYDANPTEEQVTWSATYVNMVADKANSTTAANNYLGGDANNRTSSRFYKNSTLTITPNAKEITSVVFTATSEGYATILGNSSWTNASASASGTTVTVTPTDGKNAIIAVVGGTCGFTAVQVNYKNIAPEPSYTEVRDGLTEGWYYTMCLDRAVTAVKAGSIWRVLSKAANGTDVILEEVIGTLEAGRPYIFLAAASTLEVAYTGDAVGAPVNDDDNNGLIGSFSQVKIANVNTNYIIYNNALYYVNSDNVYVGEHRAYLDMTGVPDYEPQQGNNARRRVTMAVYGKDEAQGFDNLESGDAPKKVMINGTLYIFRGEKQYDATGRLVK